MLKAALSLITASFLGAAALEGVDMKALDFEKGVDLSRITASDATKLSVSERDGRPALCVETGTEAKWPGFVLRAPEGGWDLSKVKCIKTRVKNAGSELTLSLKIMDAKGIEKDLGYTGFIRLAPDAKRDWEFCPARTLEKGAEPPLLPGMNDTPEWAQGNSRKDSKQTPVDMSKAVTLTYYVSHPVNRHSFEISEISFEGVYNEDFKDPAKLFPFIDQFGQYMHKDWSGKLRSEEELAARTEAERKALAATPAIPERGNFGGWTGMQLEATGFFRTQKLDGKWSLVDPEGRPFFMFGIHGLRVNVPTVCDNGREGWFKDFPGESPEFKKFLGTRDETAGYYKDKRLKTFDFYKANLKRKFGEDFLPKAVENAQRRLRSWGFTAIAGHSEEQFYFAKADRAPYVICAYPSITTAKLLSPMKTPDHIFYDVFDPSFKESLRKAIDDTLASAGGAASFKDPWCIGFFSGNEMSWSDDGIGLSLDTLASSKEQAAKKAFAEDLKAKYGEIAKLNQAWGTAHASWEAFLESRELPDKEKAKEDLMSFFERTAEQYFKTCKEAFREKVPKHLYLGCRFTTHDNEAVFRIASKHCDVVSVNIYGEPKCKLPAGSDDTPVVVGEFNYAGNDKGFFGSGFGHSGSLTQAERAGKLKSYVRAMLANPQVVGCNWYKYNDDSTIGQRNGENYQCGLVDITDTPYEETVAASRELGLELYKSRFGAK